MWLQNLGEWLMAWPLWKKVVVGILVLAVIGAVVDAFEDDGAQVSGGTSFELDEVGAVHEGDLAANEAVMSSADLGNEWPLTVEAGIVRCEGAGEVYFEAEGTIYAVNGTAQGASDAPEIDPIWADDPEIDGVKISIHPIIERGLDLCE